MDYNVIPIGDTLERAYYCSKCSFIFTNVHQLDCGCRFCSDCADEIIKYGKCIGCDEDVQNKSIDKAFQKELNMIRVNCVACEWNGKLSDYLKHYTETHKTFMCKYCKKTFNEEILLKYHIGKRINGKCELDELKCAYCEIGCNVEGLNAENMKEHLNVYAPKHLELVYYYYLSMKERIVESSVQSQSLIASSSNAPALESNESDLHKHNKRRKQDQDNYERLRAYEEKSYMEDINQIITTQDDMQQEINKNKNDLESIHNDVEELKSMLLDTNKNVNTIKNRMDKYEMLNNMGSYIWKITDVSKRIEDNKPIFSNTFYTHPYGYCARLYAQLNGDGPAHPKNLSLFFVIVKGEYDALLSWPFRLNITLEILDQSKKRKHFRDSFKPKPRSDSFSRPINDMNIPFGIQYFCSHAVLYSQDIEYIKNDEMFIKASIDINDTIEI